MKNVYKSPINKSFVKEKLIEKKVETEKESITLTNIFPTLKSILKLFSIFLVLFALLFIIWFYYLRDNKEQKIEINKIDENWNITNFKYFENLNWQNFVFDIKDCENLKEFYAKLKNQKYSISDKLLDLPNYNEILEKEIDFEKITQPISYKIPKNDFKHSVEVFNTLINYKDVDEFDLGEKFEEVELKNNFEKNRYKHTLKFLDDDFIQYMKMNVNNLHNSYQNMLEKKSKLNFFRKEYFLLINKLEACRKDMDNYEKSINNKEKLKDSVVLEFNENSIELENLIQKILIIETKLEEDKKNHEKELNHINMEINDLDFIIKNKEEIFIKIQKITEEEKNAKINMNKMKQDKEKNLQFQKDLENKKNSILADTEKMKKEMDITTKKIQISEAKLNLLYKNKNIRQILNNLINKDTKIDDFAKIMNSKISDEKEMLKELSEFGLLFNEKDIEYLGNLEGDKNQIENEIYKDKKDYKEITSKFLALKQILEQYQDINIDINKEKLVLESFINKQKDLKFNIIKNVEDLKILNNRFEKNEKEILFIQKEIDDLQKWIETQLNILKDLKNKISFSEKLLLEKKELFQEKQKAFKEYKIEQKNKIKALNESKIILEEKMEDFKRSMKTIEGNLFSVEKVFSINEKNCKAILVFFRKTIEMIPLLEKEFNTDKEKFLLIRSNIVKELEFVKYL